MPDRLCYQSVKSNTIYKTQGSEINTIRASPRQEPRTELTSPIKDGKSYLSDWSELFLAAEKKPKIPIYVSREKKVDVSNYVVIMWQKPRPKKKRQNRYRERNLLLVSIPLNLLKKTITRNHLKGDSKRNYKPQ